MALTTWLIDKSALVPLGGSPDADLWADRIERGLVHITTVTRLEVGFSSKSADEWRRAFVEPPLASMPVEHLTPAIEDRAVDVQRLLADRGHHRGPSIPDLPIAATAELAKPTVLQVDRNDELVAEVTGQAEERLRF